MIPISMLEERRRLGHDRFDEVWEGVYHLVPSPTSFHQRIERDLLLALAPMAKRRGLEVFNDLDLHDPAVATKTSYRQPDITIVARQHVSRRGIEGHAELAVEILSPDDESRAKLPFYARVGVREVWLIDPRAQTLEIFAGTEPMHVSRLGLELEVAGAILTIRDGAETCTVDISDTI